MKNISYYKCKCPSVWIELVYCGSVTYVDEWWECPNYRPQDFQCIEREIPGKED